MNKLTDEQKAMLKNMGALGYKPRRIALVMELDETEVQDAMNDSTSEFSKIYLHGVTYAEYVIDLQLFEMARSGDIKALDTLEKRKAKRK